MRGERVEASHTDAGSRQGNAMQPRVLCLLPPHLPIPPSPHLPKTTTRPPFPPPSHRPCSIIASPPSSSPSRGSGMGGLSPTATRGKAGAAFSSFSPPAFCPPPRWLFGTNLQTPSTHSILTLGLGAWCWCVGCPLCVVVWREGGRRINKGEAQCLFIFFSRPSPLCRAGTSKQPACGDFSYCTD